MTTCTNCRRDTNTDRLRVGRCMSCYRYWRKHGEERPPERMRRSPKQPRKVCSRCKERFAGPCSSKYCNACYQYKNLTGRARPRHLFADSCIVCDKPRTPGFARGRCPTCYQYWRKHGGVDRTPDLVAAVAPKGFCECGRRAQHVVTVPVGNHTETYHLCEDCHAAEHADASAIDLAHARTRGRCL